MTQPAKPCLRSRFALPALTLLVMSVFPAAGSVSDQLQPVALWPDSAGGLFVLDKIGGVIHLPAGFDIRGVTTVATFRPSWEAVDMTAARFGSEMHIFVVLSQETRGMLLEYRSNGVYERNWLHSTLLGGVAADPANRRVFLAGVLTGDIYVLNWDDPKPTPGQVFVSLHDSRTLGPLALDREKGVLYVGDLRTGEIFSIDLSSKSIRKVGQIRGQPSALCFDPARRKLFIADSVGRRVWFIRVDAKAPKAGLLSNLPDFRQPTAVAVDSTGTVWVGDSGAKAIFRLSSTGASQGTVRASLPSSSKAAQQ